MTSTAVGATEAGARTRILDAALALMGDQGVAGASMRQLAAASGVNVATIYHYFPSKADLLRSVVEEREYHERLHRDDPPLDLDQGPSERIVALVEWLWRSTLEEEAVWRLLVGESLRGDAVARTSAASLVDALTSTLETWLAEWFPELAAPAEVARLLRGQVLSLIVEHLALGPVSPEVARKRASELAAIAFPNDLPRPG